LDNLELALGGRDVQGRVVDAVGDVDVGAIVQQQAHDLVLAEPHGPVQRRKVVVVPFDLVFFLL